MLVLYMAGKKENKPTKTTTLNVTFLVSTGFTGAGLPAGLAALPLAPRHIYCCFLARPICLWARQTTTSRWASPHVLPDQLLQRWLSVTLLRTSPTVWWGKYIYINPWALTHHVFSNSSCCPEKRSANPTSHQLQNWNYCLLHPRTDLWAGGQPLLGPKYSSSKHSRL